ncbi:aspartate/glutamate racemase family protein [soil metagenome]
MAKHIGIAAVSPEGAAVCYRDIARACALRLGNEPHPIVTLHNLPFAAYRAAIDKDDWARVGEMLLESAQALSRAGAEFCFSPDNLVQHAVEAAAPRSPIPWLRLTELVAKAVLASGHKIVGLIGTKKVMTGSTYQAALGLKGVRVIPPAVPDLDMIDRIIFDELIKGEVRDESRVKLVGAIEYMKEAGAGGVILGSSEAPLILNAGNSPLPVYDTMALLADGAVEMSLAG